MGVYLDFDRKASKDWTNSEYLTRFAQFVYSRAIAADRAARADPAADELRSAVLNAIYSRRITPAGNFDDAFNRGIDRAYGAADQVLSARAAAQPDVVEALRELVALKDMKDRLKRLHEEGRGTDYTDYYRLKPLAWAAARTALGEKHE